MQVGDGVEVLEVVFVARVAVGVEESIVLFAKEVLVEAEDVSKVPFVGDEAPVMVADTESRVDEEKFDAVVGDAIVVLKVVDDSVAFDEGSGVWKEIGVSVGDAVVEFE